MENLKLPANWRGWGYKKLQAGKPDSVVGYHLSVPIITYRDQSAYPVSQTSSLQAILYMAFQLARFTLF